MKIYLKEQIINEIINVLKYHSDDKSCLIYANLLINKVNNEREILLSKKEISDVLFIKYNNEINNAIFNSLKRLNADLTGIDFDGKIIQGLNFDGLEGVVINLDMIPQKNLTNTSFNGVTLKGTLDNAIIENTNFTGYIGNVCLNPQKIINKSINGSALSGLIIDGTFDSVIIRGVNFSGAKGIIRIDPQKVPNKELIGINFSNVIICDSSDESVDSYSRPSFVGCKIHDCKFKNVKGKLSINLDLLDSYIGSKLSMCDLTGVIVEGTAKSNYEPMHCVKEDGSVIFDNVDDDLFGSYYFDDQGNCIHIYLYQSMMWDYVGKSWKYILRENEYNLKFNVEFKEKDKKKKQKLLSRFRKK